MIFRWAQPAPGHDGALRRVEALRRRHVPGARPHTIQSIQHTAQSLTHPPIHTQHSHSPSHTYMQPRRHVPQARAHTQHSHLLTLPFLYAQHSCSLTLPYIHSTVAYSPSHTYTHVVNVQGARTRNTVTHSLSHTYTDVAIPSGHGPGQSPAPYRPKLEIGLPHRPAVT